MSKQMLERFVFPVVIGILAGCAATILWGIVIALFVVDDALRSTLSGVEEVATDSGGVIESLHQNNAYSYSMTAVIRENQLGRLEDLLSEQPAVVTSEYVYSPSKLYEGHLRVGVDLRMGPEHHVSEWWRHFLDPLSVMMMFMVFVSIALSIFMILFATSATSKDRIGRAESGGKA